MTFGIRLQNEGLGQVAKYRRCCQSPLQGLEGLLVLGTPKPGYISCLLLGALGSVAHQIMERPGNPGKPADEPPVITSKAKQLCCRRWCWPVLHTLHLARLAAHSISRDCVAKTGDFTPQELALAGFQFQTCLCHPLQESFQMLHVFVERLGVDKEVVEVDKQKLEGKI